MNWLADIEPVREFFTGEPLQAASARIVSSLTVDDAALRLLRRAASCGTPDAALTYAWAAGALTGSAAVSSPVSTADLASEAASIDPENPVAQVLVGLAHAAAFGGRRATPLAARRAFGAAARLDADNLIPHLLLAAARFGTNDGPGAEKALVGARAATACRPYLSPLAGQLEAEAPWLAWPLMQLWPERAATAVRYATDSMLAQRRAAEVLSLARTMSAAGPRRTGWQLGAIGLGHMAVRALSVGHLSPQVAQALDGLSELLSRVARTESDLAARFERAAGRLVRASGAGTVVGSVAALAGFLRSRRRWPPPIIAALPGRTIAALGGAVALGSAALALVDNGAARARRRRVERVLLRDEEAAMAVAATDFLALCAELPGAN